MRPFRWMSIPVLSLFLVVVLFQPTLSPAQSADPTWLTAGLAGGTVNELLINPLSPTTLYAAVGRSVFVSTNSGAQWDEVLTSENLMSALALNPATSPPTLFAAGSKQVWRSTDDGATWTELSTDLEADVTVLQIESATNKLWAGTRAGVWRYDNAWKRVSDAPTVVWDIAFNATAMFVGAENGFFRSRNQGDTWTRIPVVPDPATQDNNIRTIEINPVTGLIVVGTWYGGIHVSDSGGDRWERKTSAPSDRSFGFLHFTDLAYVVSDYANEPPILYASAQSKTIDKEIPEEGDFPRSGVFRLEDNAVWVPVSGGLSNRYVTQLAAHPTLPGTVYAGTLGSGIWAKTSTTSDWVQQSIGLNALSVKAFVRSGPNLYAATSGDGVHRSSDNGITWTKLGAGLPRIETNAESLLVDERGTVWFGHSRNGLFRLNGDTWEAIGRERFGFTNVSGLTSTGSAIIAAYSSNQENNRRFVVLSEDRGETWREAMNGLPDNIEVYQLTTQFTINGSVVWASTAAGLFRLLPRATRWEVFGSESGLTLNDIRGITVDPNNPNVLYAYGNSVYKSQDGGASWSPRQDGLDFGLFRDLAIDPTNAQRIYLAGSRGIQRLNPITGSWTAIADGGPSRGLAVTVSTDGVVYAGSDNGTWQFVPEGVDVPLERPRTKWGVLIYLNGDNDLDALTVSVFDRLESVADNPAVCVNVLWDRFNGPTREYIVQPDTTPGVVASTYSLNQTFWEYGELDMGARSTFESYLSRARIRCPADHYFVSVVDHGGGWAPQAVPDLATRGRYRIGSGGGLSWDDTSGGNRMGTKDVQLALENATANTPPLDVLFYDACLMGTFEDVYAARSSADYLVASANIAWGTFPYDRYIESITATTTPRELAEQIVAIYSSALPVDPYIIAAYDLTRADVAAQDLRTLSAALAARLPADGDKVAQAAANVQRYDSNNDDALSTLDTVVDVVDLARKLAAAFPGTAVSTAAQNLERSIATGADPLIISAKKRSSLPTDTVQYDHANAVGLSIYFPLEARDQRRYPFYIEPEGQVDFAASTSWGTTIASLRRALPPLPPEPDVDPERYGPLLFQRSVYLPVIRTTK